MKQFVRLGVVLAVLLALFATVSAHEGREVGDGKYEIVFGWRVEPAYTNLLNGPELEINTVGTDEQPVEGLDETLQLEVSYGGKSKMLKLRASDVAGNYTSDLIPTQPGDYSFHLTGKIGDASIDETFDSSKGEFSSVNPITDIQFP